MEEGRDGRYRDYNPRLPTLSLGLSSVKLIVSKLEAEYGRAHDDGSTNRELVKYDPDIEDDFPLSPPRGQVCYRFLLNLAVALSKCIPSVTYGNFAVLALLTGFFAPRMISYFVIYPLCRLVFGTLYPAYASYKAVKTKNLKEYVKWMMYWIVFALFTCTETFTDVFLSWFPFYYEVKIVLVLWLLSPATKGSSILYRKFVHPALCRREQEIDEYIAKAKDQGYHTVLNLGTKGVNYATTVIMQTAIKGGGGLVQQIRKSYSLSDLTECDPREERGNDEADDVLAEPRLIRRAVKSSYNTRRSASESNSRSPMYFPEVDVDVRATRSRGENPDLSHIKSSEDISSGYSSADNSSSLARSSSARARARTAVTAIKRPQAAEDSEVIIEELHDDDLDFSNMPPLVNVPSPLFISHSDPPFIYQYVGDQIRIVQVLGNNPIINHNQTLSNKTKQIMNNYEKDAINATSTIKDQENPAIKSKLETDLNKDNSFLIDKTLKTNIIASDTLENVGLVNKETNNCKEEEKCKEETITEHRSEEILCEAKAHENHDDSNPISTTFSPEGKQETITGHRSDKIVSEIETLAQFESKSFTPEGKYNDTNLEYTEIHTVPKTDNVVESETFIECEDEEATFDECIINQILVKDDIVDTTSISTSNYDNESAMSDDEASFGTPEDSPRSKRKSPKGRYGKGRAPSPPNSDKTSENKSPLSETINKTSDCNISTTSQESLVEMLNKFPNITFNETGIKTAHVNPIAEKKKRHKTRSPGTISKGNSSGLGKLLQLPSKFVFWHKSEKDDKSKLDSTSVSDDQSRRSSTAEKLIDDFQSCHELNKIEGTTWKEQKSESKLDHYFDDANAPETEVISHDILDKSDALQRLIEAKLESHPEYKIVPLHGEIPSTSKSTDV